MAYTQSVSSNNNSSFQDYDNNFVYQNDVSFPTGRVDRDGNTPVRVSSVTGGYSNLGSAGWSIVKSSTETSGGAIFSTSGGVMQVRQYSNSSSRMYFGRNTGLPGTVYDNGDGQPFQAGALAYSMDWQQVASKPADGTIARTGRSITITNGVSADSGGGSISAYRAQYRTSSDNSSWSAWTGETNFSYGYITWNNLNPATWYQYRVYAVNEAGNSEANLTASVFVPAGGKRWTGSNWDSTTIARRWNGSAWADLTIAKRWNGSAWVDLT